MKIIPKVPDTLPGAPSNPSGGGGSWWRNRFSPINGPGWSTNPMVDTGIGDLIDGRRNPNINIEINTTPWYRDLTTWLWISGVTVGIFVLVGAGIYSYTHWSELFGVKTGENGRLSDRGSPQDSPRSEPDVELTDIRNTRTDPVASTSQSRSPALAVIPPSPPHPGPSSTSLGKLKAIVTSLLPPLSWTYDNSTTREGLLDQQCNPNTRNYRLYPYTSKDPSASRFDQWRIRYFGETASEIQKRRLVRQDCDFDLNYILRPRNTLAWAGEFSCCCTSRFTS